MRAPRLLRSAVLRALVVLVAGAATCWADVSDRIARVVPISTGVPISVDITVGGVSVRAWDRDEVSIEIIRHAPQAADFARIPAQVEQGPDGLLVRAIQTDGTRDASLRTDMVLRVPAAAHLKSVSVFEGRIELSELRGAVSARTERGDIAATGVTGIVRLETAIGSIRLTNAALTPQGLIRLRTFNGDVALELAVRPEHARILALSMGGTIESEIPLSRKDRWGPRSAEATIGKGEPLISIDVVNGDIAITVAKRSIQFHHDQ